MTKQQNGAFASVNSRMSPLKKPKTLLDICLCAVKDLLVEDHEHGDEVDDSVRDLFKSWLMPDLSAQILLLVFNDDFLNLGTKINVFTTLFDENFKSLSFGVGAYHDTYHNNVVDHFLNVCQKHPRLEVIKNKYSPNLLFGSVEISRLWLVVSKN